MFDDFRIDEALFTPGLTTGRRQIRRQVAPNGCASPAKRRPQSRQTT